MINIVHRSLERDNWWFQVTTIHLCNVCHWFVVYCGWLVVCATEITLYEAKTSLYYQNLYVIIYSLVSLNYYLVFILPTVTENIMACNNTDRI